PWPPKVALFGGGGCILLGALMLGLAAFFPSGGGRRHPPAYLFYPEVLVEVFPDRHREIPWEAIGYPKPTTFRHRRFPVEGDAEIHFDDSMPDAAGLARAITARLLLRDVGGPAAADALAAGSPAPYF